MALRQWRNPNNTEVKRVYSCVPANVEISDVFTLILTEDDGTAQNNPFTATAATVKNAVEGLQAAWDASVNPDLYKYIATEDDTQVILTARTAGVNPPITGTAVDGGGTDDQSLTITETTTGISNKSYGTGRNWNGDAVPSASDDVEFDVGSNADGTSIRSVDCIYDLDQSGTTIGDFRVRPGYQGRIGRFENGKPYYLKLDMTGEFDFRGSGPRGMFDLGSSAVAAYIQANGNQQSQGQHTVYLKGSALTTVEIARGNVGIAALQDETCNITTLVVGYLLNQQGDSNVTVGPDATVDTIIQDGGKLKLRSGVTTAVTVAGGAELTKEGTGTIPTLTVRAGGTAIVNGGNVTTLNGYGKIDFSRDRTAKTISSVVVYDGMHLILHDAITVSAWDFSNYYGRGVKIERV